MTDAQVVLRILRHNFSTLLRGDYGTNSTREECEPEPIDDEGVEIPLLWHNEVAIQRLRHKKAAGPDDFPAELFRAEGDEMVGSMCHLQNMTGRKHSHRL